MKVKEWFYNKLEETSSRYNMFIDVYSRNSNGTIETDENGYLTVKVEEILNESEKAVQVILSTGGVVGLYNGWKTWIPKSLISWT